MRQKDTIIRPNDGSSLGRKDPEYRPRGLRAELPQGNGIRRQVDVLRGRRACDALGRQAGQPHEHGRIPGRGGR